MTITYNTYSEMLLSTSPATSVERDPYGPYGILLASEVSKNFHRNIETENLKAVSVV
jgi:hypothetical protein